MSLLDEFLLFKKLLEAKTHENVEDILADLKDTGEEYVWLPLGNKPGNASHVQLISDPLAALVERITNSFDALIERQLGLDFRELTFKSPREAVEKLFNIPGGRLDELDVKEREKLGNEIQIIFSDSGKKFMPNVVILDLGVGQHPLDFPRTLLSLGESDKLDKYYLCGSFGQGGASTLWFCEYTIVVSRRRPEHLLKGYSDLAGWTIIRKNTEDIRYKNYTYEYLAVKKPNGEVQIPCIQPENLNGFSHGTYIKHIEFEIGPGKYYPTAFVGTQGYRIFNSYLFDPILPFSIEGEIKRTVPGTVARLRSDARMRVEYPGRYEKPLKEGGKLVVRYWALKSKPIEEAEETNYLDSYLDKPDSTKTIIITLNGQRHGFLEKEFVKAVGLPYLRNYLLVHVDCDNLPIKLKRELFLANRSAIKEGEIFELIKEAVKEALDDDKLKQLNEKRKEQQFTEMDEETERKVRGILNRLIKNYLTRGQGVTPTSMVEIQIPGGEDTFEPAEMPTYLAFQEEEAEIEQGSKRIVHLLTDAPDGYLNSKNVKLKVGFAQKKGLTCVVGKLKQGVIPVTVNCPVNIPAETEEEFKCELLLHDGASLEATIYLLVTAQPPPTPYLPVDPPNIFKILGPKQLKLKAGRRNRVRFELNGPDDLFSRPINRASFAIYCSIPDAGHVGTRGPNEGKLQTMISIPESAEGLDGFVKGVVALSDGTRLEDEKPCMVVKPTKRQERKYRRKPADELGPRYRIQPIYKEKWGDQWNENKIGEYIVESDGLLTLYVNMDASPVAADRQIRLARGEYEDRIKHVSNRYIIHLAFHLYQLYHRYEIEKPNLPSGLDIETMKNDELSRVADTLLLALSPISQM